MENKVFNLLNDKVDDIFLKIQEEYKIENGDVMPWDMLELNNSIQNLAEIITKILNKQKQNYKEKIMKIWDIEEFIKECKELSKNQYTYNSDNMPEGICNNHNVSIYEGQWHSVLIDNNIYNLGVINDKLPNENTEYIIDGESISVFEYIKRILES